MLRELSDGRKCDLMHKQPEVTAATRARLMDAFWTLYRERPIEKISVSAVVALAGVHRSTFYEYFSDIYDLLEQMESSLAIEMEQTIARLTERLPEVGDPIFQIASQLAEQFAPYAERIYYLSRDPGFQSRMLDTFKPHLQRVSRLPDDSPKLDFLLTLLPANMLTAIRYWFEHKESYSIQELVGMVQKLLYYGLAKFISEGPLSSQSDQSTA